MTHAQEVVLDEHIARLTDPSIGIVHRTEVEDLFSLRQPDAKFVSPDSNNLLIVTGPSGAGKDTYVGEIKAAYPAFTHVRTATSRARRESEPEDSYTWMRPRGEDEDIDDYAQELIGAYDLIEHDFHHGHLYGLPRNNLAEAAESGIPIINTDTRGIRTLNSHLACTNVVSVLVCPENTSALVNNMGDSRDNIIGRLTTAQAYLTEAVDVVDYVALNRSSDDFRQQIRKMAAKIVDYISLTA